ncbi:lamin tail domain-containing protein [bacterium]|nr:lamin tail domain-containing protein [bacterium]
MKEIILSVLSILLVLFIAVLQGSVPGDIVVNEVMYNSAGIDEEWVELFNNTAAPITLDSTWTLSDGEGLYKFEDFSIPAGEYVTIEVFTNDSFPFIPDIDATSSGIQLANGYDQVVLKESDLIIDSVEYYDSWGDMGHDGDGPSLEKRHPSAAPDDASDWNSSTVEGGTPGAINSIYASFGDEKPVVYGMKRSITMPTSSEEVDVTVIAYDDVGVTTVELVYHTGEPPHTSLEMADDGAHGDREANDNIYGATIPAMPHAATVYYFARVVDTGAQEDTTETDDYLVNDSLAFDCQVVINEIMYNSISTDTEYVELYNREADDIDISGWQIKDATANRFTFPEGTIISGFSYLVVCKDTLEIIGGYGIFNVIGNAPYSLNNDNDKVLLFDAIGFLMDSVMYYDGGDWPGEADGNGPSLELVDPFLDNTLPASWEASDVIGGTPGETNSVGIEEGDNQLKANELRISGYPNPFNSSITISFSSLLTGAPVRIDIYDISGRLLESIGPTVRSAVSWHPDASLGSGIYFVRVKFEGRVITERVLYLK